VLKPIRCQNVVDLLTSFSNPNYGLGCDLAELQIHSVCRTDTSNNNNDGGDAAGGIALIDTGEENSVGGWQQDMSSSGDSAISSPTESCLASPMVGGLVVAVACNTLEKSETEAPVPTIENSDITSICSAETQGETVNTNSSNW